MVDKEQMEEIRQEELQYMQDTLKLTEAEAIKFLDSHDGFVVELGKLKNREAALTVIITTAAALAFHSQIAPDKFFDIVKEVVLACALESGDAVLNTATWQKVGEA